MYELIDRAQRGEATAAELRQLATWRASAPEAEREYQELVQLLDAARALALTGAGSPIPTAAALLSRRTVGPELATHRRARRHIPYLPWAVAAGLLVALSGVLIRSHVSPAALAWGGATVTTGPRELATVRLADGSVVRVGPGSELQMVPGDAREVRLEGQAFFSIAHLPERPFRVHTQHGSAEVLGTRFEVNTRAEQLDLIVVEGRVALSSGTRAVEVRGGETSGIVDGRVREPRRVANADSLVQWVGRFLVFQETPLAEAVAQVERLYGVRITIADSVVARRTVTANFTDRGIEHITGVLCAVVNARCEERADEIVITQ